MSDNIIQLNEGLIKQELKELVRSTVEETLNNLLELEAAELTKAERYERTSERQGYRSGHYERNLTTLVCMSTRLPASRLNLSKEQRRCLIVKRQKELR